MSCTLEMFAAITMPAPKGSIPDGMKVTALAGPDTLQPAPSCPALAIGSFTLWPMSYIDNRVSFGMVLYDPEWKVVKSVEKAGARYICEISLNGSGETGSVTFSGQANQSVTMSVDEICKLL